MTGEHVCGYIRSAGFVLCALLGATAAVAPAYAQPSAAPVPIALREGEARSASQSAGERFTYDVEITDEQRYLVRIEQRGLDLIVTVDAPNGGRESFNSPLFRDRSEFVVLGPDPGHYRIEVHSDENTGASGGHTATLTRLPPGTDAREIEAWQAMSAGSAANFTAGEDGWQRAVAAYARAAELWRELDRTPEEADALFSVATLRYWQLFEWGAAADFASRAAALYGAQSEAVFAANAQQLQGAALVEQALEAQQSTTSSEISPESEALFAAAFDLLEQARGVHERLGNVYDLGLVLNNFGYTYYGKGDLTRARRYYGEAATLLQSAAEWSGEAMALANLAVLDAEVGQLVNAEATFERIVELLPPTRPADRANALDNLAAVQRMLGDLEGALQTSVAALELQRQADDDQGEGRSLRRIGEAYYLLGDLELATQYLQRALPIAELTNDGRNQEAVLRSLGNVAFAERGYADALDYHRRALETAASVSDRAHLQIAIAKDLAALGRAEESQVAAAAAQLAADDSGSESLVASALNAAGRAEILVGDTAAATASLERAAAIFASLGLRAERADALHGLALAARAGKQLDLAIERSGDAVRELEGLRARIVNPELRAFFGGTRRDYYETQIDLLMTRSAEVDESAGAAADDFARRALEVSERGRARMIADLLQEASVELWQEPDAGLRAQQTALYEQLAERRYQRDLLIEQGARGAALDSAVGELATLENSLNIIEIERRRGNPKYAALTAPEPLTAAQMQALLDPDTVLLQYALGAEVSYVWAVTRDATAVFALADRTTIEAAARRALAELKAYSQPAGAAPSAALSELASLVLAPAAAQLVGRPRVLLALDGALQYVPFAALPLEHADGAEAPLLATHEIVEVPSLSVLALNSTERTAHVQKTLAVFADPVLQSSDPRFGTLQPVLLAATAASTANAASAVNEIAPRAATAALGRLLSTGYEGEAIAALVPDDRRLLASGFAASRGAVLDDTLYDFRYIHFATHGVVDARYPGLSALVLSQFDDQGNPQDGVLRLNDIYNMKLDADLVVLSACDTALGREVRGEGLLGLTQGFLSAGARRLVASLWQVPDRATAELMTKFYGYLLTDGLRPAEALRRAQMWSASQRRYQHPYFWGGFVLVGDWR